MDKVIFLDIDGVLNSQQWYKYAYHSGKYKDHDDFYHMDPDTQLVNYPENDFTPDDTIEE